MKLIHQPEGGERQEFIFRPAELQSLDSEDIESLGPWETFEEFGEKFLKGNLRARRAALWVMLRRTNPRLKFADVSVRVDEVDLDLEDDERANVRAAVESDPDMDDEARREALVLLRGVEPVGKEPEGDGPTDSPSPEPDSEPSPNN